MSYAEKMRELSKQNRPLQTIDEDIETRKRKSDIRYFFKTFIKGPSKKLVEKEAMKGYTTAVIYEYQYYDYFYIDKDDKFNFIPSFKNNPGHYLYRIFTVINDSYFIGLMDDYFKKELGMMYNCSRLPHNGKTANGIEVFWGDLRDMNIPQKWFNIMMNNLVDSAQEDPSLSKYNHEPPTSHFRKEEDVQSLSISGYHQIVTPSPHYGYSSKRGREEEDLRELLTSGKRSR